MELPRPEIVIAIALCALVTVIPRILPFVLMRKIAVSDTFIAWLRLLPPSILAALLIPEIILVEDNLRSWPGIGIELVACLVVIIIAMIKPGNLMLCVLGGIIAYASIQAIF